MYKVCDVANIFKVNKCTIYAWIKNGTIKHIKVGKSIRIPTEEVENAKLYGIHYMQNSMLPYKPKKRPRFRSEGIKPWED